MNTPERNRLAVVLLGLAAVACSVWGAVKLIDLFAVVYRNHGGAGFVASPGAPEMLAYMTPAFTAILSTFVRDRHPYGRVLHRGFVLATVVPIGLIVLFIAVGLIGTFAHGVNGVWALCFGSAVVASTLWMPMQTFFVFAFLSLLIVPRVPAA